jgi:hypothetical protein
MTHPDRAAVDTNVLNAANARDTHASADCVAISARFLAHAARDCVVLLDSAWRIIGEYKHKCNVSGQPGPGDRFLLQVLRTQADPRRVRTVDITPDGDSYAEVPATLSAFDPADHKFIAVVVADGQGAPIVNSTDSDWANDAHTLREAGISVHELCGCRPRGR